ncbi:hypothetical protein OC846_001816 [Tilletia horrida]|uniref:Rab-GAP TBC domain-containing protein n=1 Tax=Tilletia horrida TaxID=155126 RepID=A0AAN6JTH0_9BASI|nr:hypothetical protein OC846_001816 [Tilletia horrida]
MEFDVPGPQEFADDVWMYLLGVLAADTSNEESLIRERLAEYDSLNKSNQKLEQTIRHECSRYYQRRLIAKMKPGKPKRPAVRTTEQPDREQAAAAELKRFTDKTESIICAYLNSRNSTTSHRSRSIATGSVSTGKIGTSQFSSGPDTISNPDQPRTVSRMGSQLSEHNLDTATDRYHPASSNSSDNPAPSGRESTRGLADLVDSGPASASIPDSYTERGVEPKRKWFDRRDNVRCEHGADARGDLESINVDGHLELAHQCIRNETGMYFSFARLMQMLVEDYNKMNPLWERVSTFLTLLRLTLPELHAYFEEEEVDIVGVATRWLQNLLSAEMRIDDVMRLWDVYFSQAQPLDLHLYVCIAILMVLKDQLEELDHSECKSMLNALPDLDVEMVVNEAINIRLSQQQSMEDDDEDDEEADQEDGGSDP